MKKKIKRKTKFNNKNSTHRNRKYKSKLEAECSKQLTENNIPFSYESQTFVILEGSKYWGEVYELYGRGKHRKFRKVPNPKISKVTYTPDFTGFSPYINKYFIIETKGVATSSFNIKWKLFKKYLNKSGAKEFPLLFMPRNKKDIEEVIKVLKP